MRIYNYKQIKKMASVGRFDIQEFMVQHLMLVFITGRETRRSYCTYLVLFTRLAAGTLKDRALQHVSI